MVSARNGPDAASRLPLRFEIRVSSVGLKPEEVNWDVVRRCVSRCLVDRVLRDIWNKLGPKALLELKKRVAKQVPGDDWCELFHASVIDHTELWQQIRAGIIHSVVVDVDASYQSEIWPHLQPTIQRALMATEPSVVICSATMEDYLQIEIDLQPFVIEFGRHTVRSDVPCIVSFAHTLHWVNPLEVYVCLGDT